MAESIQKATIPIQSLPAVVGSGEYLIRYRVISEDQNRISSWSPIYSVSPYPDGVVPVNSEIVVNGQIATVVWGNAENNPSYDIFVGYGFEPEMTYQSTTISNNYSFILQPANSVVKVVIQIASAARQINAALLIAESEASLV